MRALLFGAVGAAGLLASGITAPVSADDLNSVVRTLNAVINPGDAQPLEDQARRNGRGDEERYWRDYRAGLDQRQPPQQYGGGSRSSDRIGPEEARRREEQARSEGRWEDQRYWHNYSAGLAGGRPDERGEGPPPYRPVNQYSGRISPDQASQLEEQARRNGRSDEVRYWSQYRSGLEGGSR